MIRTPGHGQHGLASIWVLLVTAGAFTMLLGLVVDAGTVVNARLEAARTAQQAARVGADALSQSSVRSGGDAVDAEAAARLAHGYLRTAGRAGTVRVDGDAVSVTVTGRSPTRILGAFGIASFPVRETGTAHGITGEETP